MVLVREYCWWRNAIMNIRGDGGLVEGCVGAEGVRLYLIVFSNFMNLYKNDKSGDHLVKAGMEGRMRCFVALFARVTSELHRWS